MADTQVIHSSDLTITQMVYNRLPFLAPTENNDTLISNFVIEVMYELEPCFQIDKDLPAGDDTHIGNEQYYSVAQKSIIADIVCVYILMIKMLANIGGIGNDDGTTTPVTTKELSRVKAGSVEVEWDKFDLTKNAGLYISGDKLMQLYKKSAIRKAHALGCIIDICDDCTTTADLLATANAHPFKVTISGCGCGGGNIPEQG